MLLLKDVSGLSNKHKISGIYVSSITNSKSANLSEA